MSNIGNRALKAGAWYTVCTFILKGISFITMPLFTRLMSEADIGVYSNFTSWITILSGIITLDLFTSINLAHFEYKDKLAEYMSTIAMAGSAYTLLLYGGCLIFKDKLISLLGINEYMFHIMFIYFLVNPAIAILHAKFRIYLEYKQTIITSLIPTGCSILISLLFVLLFKDNRLEGRTFGYYGAWILFSLAIYAYVLIKGKTFRLEYIKFALPISIPLIFHTLANTVLSTSDRIMITRICGPINTAHYSVAYSCALIISILWNAINQAWAPWCYEMMNKSEESNIRRVSRPLLLLFTAFVIVVILIAPEVLLLMGGEKYLPALYVIPPVMLGYIAQMLYTLYVNIEYYHKKQKQIMFGTAIAAVFNVVLNLVFIPVFGYVAAAYTTFAGYILLFGIHFLFVKRMGKQAIYDTKFNCFLLVSSFLVGLLATMLYGHAILRWIVIILVGTLLISVSFRHRDEIISSIKNRNFDKLLTVLHLE